ncbi:hypothetical protein VPHF86_0310 [Vibrio phage F86]
MIEEWVYSFSMLTVRMGTPPYIKAHDFRLC